MNTGDQAYERQMQEQEAREWKPDPNLRRSSHQAIIEAAQPELNIIDVRKYFCEKATENSCARNSTRPPTPDELS